MVQEGSTNYFRGSLKRFCSAIRAACFQLVTSDDFAVTAEAAGSSPVVPAILLNGLLSPENRSGFVDPTRDPHPQIRSFSPSIGNNFANATPLCFTGARPRTRYRNAAYWNFLLLKAQSGQCTALTSTSLIYV